MSSGHWVVLYDSDCGFCKWALSWILRWDRRRVLRSCAIQSAAADEPLAGMAPDERLASWHLVSPAGERRSGGAALPALLRLLRGGRPFAWVLERAPRVTDAAYRWVATHRSRLSKWVPKRSKSRAAGLVSEREALFPSKW
jgi:predicted DCC family thiol-disulfide oxidoreductase YuxK